MAPAFNEDEPRWFKSSRSSGNGACVEVAFVATGAVAMRDSKDPKGPVLRFPAAVWREFVESVRTGNLSRSA
jgi:hypothetical protein